ncbi:GTP binding protein-like protein, partial [Aureobasidium pullulans]
TRPWIEPRSRHCSQTIRQICNFDFSQFITRRVSLYRNQPSTVATHVTQTTLSSRNSRPIPNKHHPPWLPPSTRCATTVLESPEFLALTRIAPQIKQIEDEMAKTQKNKATSYHLGQLKAKLAKLKRELLTPSSSGGGGGAGFDVARTGVASVGFIGFPSVGKSTLMSRLTGQHSEAAAYEFTTLTTVPGQVMYNGAKIQILDLPGIIQGAKDGKGRGRQVIAVAKTCHLIFIVLDVNKPLTDKRVIENELEGFGIRINKSPPNIHFKKKDKGGISITNTVPLTHIDHDEIKAVMNEYKISSADIAIRCDATIDDLIDILEAKSRSYIPVIYALNKIDAISIEELDLLYRIPNACPISSEHGWNVDELMEQMWEKLSLCRVYTKPKGKAPDYTAPVVLRANARTVEDFCNAIHKTIVEQFKVAIVYGKSVRHQPQRVGLSHELADEDVLTIIKR